MVPVQFSRRQNLTLIFLASILALLLTDEGFWVALIASWGFYTVVATFYSHLILGIVVPTQAC